MKRWRSKIRNFKHSNDMVSEVIGTVVLLGIAVAVFSTMYVMVISSPSPPSSTIVNLVGTVEGNNIIIEHRGGESLGLDSKITISIGSEVKQICIGDENYLDDDAKKDGMWNVGEKLVYPFSYSLDYNCAEIVATNEESNSLVMIGTLDITPDCDIGIKQTVSNKSPFVGNKVNLTTRITMYRGDIAATSVKINNKLPDGLTYYTSFTNQGVYDPISGIWEINNLGIGESVFLNVTADVTSTGTTEFTQLAILLDGSRSINKSEWKIMIEGLADAIKNPYYFPHSGDIELTVIQFGGGAISRAQLEVGPVIVTEANYISVSNQIKDLILTGRKMGGNTPMACAINLAADIISGDPNNHLIGTDWEGKESTNTDFKRQVINIVTDGQPNIICNEGEYSGTWPGSNAKPDEYTQGKASTEIARDYLYKLIGMNSDDGDELDAVAVGDETDVDWMRDCLVIPQPGYDSWPPPGPGWVRPVDSYQEFADSIHELFEVLFSDITHSVEIISSTPIDINPHNDKSSIMMSPTLP